MIAPFNAAARGEVAYGQYNALLVSQLVVSCFRGYNAWGQSGMGGLFLCHSVVQIESNVQIWVGGVLYVCVFSRPCERQYSS